MTRRLQASWFLTAGALFAASTVVETAKADQAALSGARESVQTTGPNRGMLRSGLWTLGIGYVPAVIVAMQSSEAADDNLYIPVAGPWIDYARRDCPTCSHETVNKVLLVTDGLFQGLGALQIVGSFLFPETRTASVAAKGKTKTPSSFRLTKLTPARFETGAYGLAARGSF